MVTAYFGFSDPNAKNNMFKKRIQEFKSAVKRRLAPARVQKAVERVRSAAISAIKARRTFVASHPAILQGKGWDKHGDRLMKELANLDRELHRWNAMSLDEIVQFSVERFQNRSHAP